MEPVIPPDKQARLNQILLLYDKLIAQDKPDPNNAEDIKRWLIRKRALQKMILEELDLDQYVDILLGPEITLAQEKAEEASPNDEIVTPVAPSNDTLPPKAGNSPPVANKNKIRELIGKIPGLGKMLNS
ncbi:MAG: hypothetical protein GYA55_02810 [SAR324 cluster bacterium]|uniref:Uncharacterized protein n=1 Tax=SAR324 cluster bacterium TaxID=2024889 RepID=A0A7X9FPT9_9DELT|nr:hypothetical protein [SAR324 cluster bacterium]